MTKSMTTGTPAKLIILFAFPLIIGNIFQQFYSMADTFIVGRTLGVNALAAVGCTGSITFFILGFVMGFSSGLSIITSQRFGANDMEGVKRSFATSLILSLILSVVFTIGACIFTHPFLELLQTPPELIDDAYSYLIIIFGGIIASVLYNFLSNMMRALGDSKMPLYFLIFTCILNIILDYVCILFFNMGVAGAGAATIFSQVIAAILCVVYIKKKMPAFWVERKHFQITRHEISCHIKTALPMAFQMSIIAIGALILQSALNGLGPNAVAGNTSAQKIDSIACMPLNSFGAAMATYAAQNYGAGKIDRIRKGVFQCILMSVGTSIFMAIMNFSFGGTLASVFIGADAPEVVEYAQIFLSVNGAMYWVLSLLFIYRFTLQGLGNGTVPTIAGIMELIMRAIGGIFLVDILGYTGAALSNPLAWTGACIPLCIAYYREIRKLEKNHLANATYLNS